MLSFTKTYFREDIKIAGSTLAEDCQIMLETSKTLASYSYGFAKRCQVLPASSEKTLPSIV